MSSPEEPPVPSVPRDAVRIDAASSFLCLRAQHLYLNERFGRHQWQPYRVSSDVIDDRIYDRYDLWFESESPQTVWFDITDSVAIWAPERVQTAGRARFEHALTSSPAALAPIVHAPHAQEFPMASVPLPPLILEAAQGSFDGRLHFGQVIDLLVQAGVESYHVDYRSQRTTYYLPEGATVVVGLPAPEVSVAEAFDANGVRAVIAGAQQGRVMYPEFMRRTLQAGCVGYIVWIAGRQVSYFGRRGEMHVEAFPR